jgi:hypothetical protein
MTIAVPKTDGWRFSWPSFTLNEGADIVEGVRGFNVKVIAEGRVPTYDRGRFPNGFTKGKLRFEGQVMWRLDFWNDWTKTKGAGWFDRMYAFTGLYEEGPDIRDVAVGGLVWTEFESTAQEGDEGLVITKPFLCLKYTENGLNPFDEERR